MEKKKKLGQSTKKKRKWRKKKKADMNRMTCRNKNIETEN